jgi:hypothetical protein
MYTMQETYSRRNARIRAAHRPFRRVLSRRNYEESRCPMRFFVTRPDMATPGLPETVSHCRIVA